ncbi:MAG TPA: chemotaxis-specific protein-glutamate methyltransferase CheB [Ferrovibrio sp.]|uniref:chemotaxis-specific protein-glutamate methyltransferase CheB n=1 Tax=Ferrovibrio sp. TaxID=1917215 RepID=UPI002ED0373E
MRALIVENSPHIAQTIADALRREPDIEVCAIAATGPEGVAAAIRLKVDIVIMGIRLPKMDGFEATKEIMIESPTPIVLLVDDRDAAQVEISMRALRAGALSVIPAPKGGELHEAEAARRQFIQTVRLMAGVKVVRRWRRSAPAPQTIREQRTATSASARPGIIAIAASTGGPAALQRVLADLPASFPIPILAVQHISHGFISGMVDWLNTVCSLKVRIATNGQRIEPHTVYFASDDRHLGVSSREMLQVSDAAPLDGFRPSANYLFSSVAQHFGAAAAGVVLTGMGRDGTEGLKALRKAGGRVIAQDEATSVVFGMPGSAISAGVVQEVLPLPEIPFRLAGLASLTSNKEIKGHG